MIKIYYSSKIDNAYWKIYSDFIGKPLSYFPAGTDVFSVANRVCQVSLFDMDNTDNIYIVDITDWSLRDKQTIAAIKEIAEIKKLVVFALESTTVKNKLWTELKVECIKANNVNIRSKQEVVNHMLLNANISLDASVKEYLIGLLPNKINSIKNEIDKLALLHKSSFTKDEIKQIIFDSGEVTIFNVIDSWLQGDMDSTIKGLNDFLASNYDVVEFIPIFTYKLMQLKLFYKAKKANWSDDVIFSKLGIPTWQQITYAKLKPYDKILTKINNMITKLYNFDINIKKQKNVPYAQLIRLLFE